MQGFNIEAESVKRTRTNQELVDEWATLGGLTTAIEFLHGRSAWGETIRGKMEWAEFGWDWAADPNAAPPLGLPNATPNLTPWPNPLTYGIGKKDRNGTFVAPKITGWVDP